MEWVNIVLLVAVVVGSFASLRKMSQAEEMLEYARDMFKLSVEKCEAVKKKIQEHEKEMARQRFGDGDIRDL